jgi:hypothetical protein
LWPLIRGTPWETKGQGIGGGWQHKTENEEANWTGETNQNMADPITIDRHLPARLVVAIGSVRYWGSSAKANPASGHDPREELASLC